MFPPTGGWGGDLGNEVMHGLEQGLPVWPCNLAQFGDGDKDPRV